jgi:hypothetical protein
MKTLGDIAYEAFYAKMNAIFAQDKMPSKAKDSVGSKCWEAAAEAVRKEVAAKILAAVVAPGYVSCDEQFSQGYDSAIEKTREDIAALFKESP